MRKSGGRQIPAILCFKPEQQRTGCYITPFIKHECAMKYINLSNSNWSRE